MTSREQLRGELAAALSGAGTALKAADALCHACVQLLDVDGAAISLVHEGATRGTFGSSSALSRRLDAYQFTYGEGPCLDAVQQRRPVVADDLTATTERRWPAFTASAVDAGVRAVFALPIVVATESIGALDLFRHRAGPLPGDAVSGGLQAADLAALPLLDLIAQIGVRAGAGVVEGAEEDPWSELESLERVEIYQATGFLIAQLGPAAAGPSEALVRLRARAFSTGQTAADVAQEVLERRLRIDPDGTWHRDGGEDGPGEGGDS